MDLSNYLEHRRDLFGLESDALFASSRGRRERLPLRSIAQVIQMQIEAAGLTDRICPADLARYPVAKLISGGAGPQDAIVMTGYKRVPGVSEETNPSGSDSLKAFHPCTPDHPRRPFRARASPEPAVLRQPYRTVVHWQAPFWKVFEYESLGAGPTGLGIRWC